MVGHGGSWGGLLHVSRYHLISIVTIQSDLRPLWTNLKPSKFHVETPSKPILEGHKSKTKQKFTKMARQVLDICTFSLNEGGFETVDYGNFDSP